MRLRNIPGSEDAILVHRATVKEETTHRGSWKNVFGNDRPIRIEIGMGKGQFILNMALQHPEINFIGIERYSSVLLKALGKYDTDEFKDLQNIRFICMDAARLEEVFAPGEIDRIYLNFSDPWPKARHARRRLTSSNFLKRYEPVLSREGFIEFKTDNRLLFDFSLEQIEAAGWHLIAHTFDLHHDTELNTGNVMTEYEAKFSAKGNPIHKLIASPPKRQ